MFCSVGLYIFLALLHFTFLVAPGKNQTWLYKAIHSCKFIITSFFCILYICKFLLLARHQKTIKFKVQDISFLEKDLLKLFVSILTWHKSTDLFLWSLRKRLVRHVCIHWKKWLISGSGFLGVFCREVFIHVFCPSYGPLLGSTEGRVRHRLPAWADCVNGNKNHHFHIELKGMGVFWWKTLWYGPWGRLNKFISSGHIMKCEFQIHSKLAIACC